MQLQIVKTEQGHSVTTRQTDKKVVLVNVTDLGDYITARYYWRGVV